MAIIKSKKKSEKESVRISIDNHLLEKIKTYCEWAGVGKPDDFFEQAAEYVLAKDRDWQGHLNQKTAA